MTDLGTPAHKQWLSSEKSNYLDNSTNEYDLTGIAEGLADQFNLYVDTVDYEIPEEVFDYVSGVVPGPSI